MRKEIEIAGLEALNRLDESLFIIPVVLSGNRIPDLQLNSITKLSDLNLVNVGEDGRRAVVKLISTMETATLADFRNDPTVETLNKERFTTGWFRLSKFHLTWKYKKDGYVYSWTLHSAGYSFKNGFRNVGLTVEKCEDRVFSIFYPDIKLFELVGTIFFATDKTIIRFDYDGKPLLLHADLRFDGISATFVNPLTGLEVKASFQDWSVNSAH